MFTTAIRRKTPRVLEAFWHWPFPVLVALMLWCPEAIAVEGPLVAVQEALKKQQFFFGEPSGVLDEPTRAALRRFQARHNLQATGEIDTATINALQSLAVAGTNSPRIGETGVKASTVEEDREFLRKIENGTEPIPSLSPVPPAFAPATTSARWSMSGMKGFPRPSPTKVQNESAAPGADEPPSFRSEQVEPRRTRSEGSDSSRTPMNDSFGRTLEVQKERLSEKSRKVERAPLVRTDNLLSRRGVEIDSDGPPLRATARFAHSGVQIPETDDDSDPIEPRGTRIIRITTTGTDGRTYVTTERRTALSGPPNPIIRRAEAVPARPRQGFLHRIFGDD